MITRFGGTGDLLMIEPTIEAIYYKYSPCEITLRTYKDYADVMRFHPLIKDIVLDDISYALGKTPPGYDLYFNFQDVIERLGGIHGVDAFAGVAQTPLLRRTPLLFIDPNVPIMKKEEIVIQLDSTAPNRRIDGIDVSDSVYLIKNKMPTHEYFSLIANSRVFLGVDSSGLHIAAATGVPQVVGVYCDKYPAEIRKYPRIVPASLNDNEDIMRKFENAVRSKTYPDYLKMGTALQFVQEKALSHCRGLGYDVGASKSPLPGSMSIRLDNRQNMNHQVDYIFSSHYLQCIEQWEQEIQLWEKLVRPSGTLFIYLPHPRMEHWRPGGAWCGQTHKWIPEPFTLVKHLMEKTNFKVIEYSSHPDMYWSFYIVAKRGKN